MFRLLRYFSITSAVAILSVTVVLVNLYRQNAVKQLEVYWMMLNTPPPK